MAKPKDKKGNGNGKEKLVPIPPPPPPPTPLVETGSVRAICEGSSETNVNFRPSKMDYTIVEDIPGSPSCNPAHKPTVKISNFQLKNGLWAIRFEWSHLTGVNYINWTATE